MLILMVHTQSFNQLINDLIHYVLQVSLGTGKVFTTHILSNLIRLAIVNLTVIYFYRLSVFFNPPA